MRQKLNGTSALILQLTSISINISAELTQQPLNRPAQMQESNIPDTIIAHTGKTIHQHTGYNNCTNRRRAHTDNETEIKRHQRANFTID